MNIEYKEIHGFTSTARMINCTRPQCGEKAELKVVNLSHECGFIEYS